MTHLVGKTQNNIPIYVNLIGSEAGKQIAREPYLLTLATEILRHTNLKQSVVTIEHDMGRDVGYDFIVNTTPSDVIFYAQLVQDTAYTRFTKNGEPKLTSYVSLVVRRDKANESYTIEKLHLGRMTPPKTGSAEETTESKQYWEDHALVFRDQSHQSRSLTKTCPY